MIRWDIMDHLAEWLSQYPSLGEDLDKYPHSERYMREHPAPEPRNRKVSDEQWADVLLELMKD